MLDLPAAGELLHDEHRIENQVHLARAQVRRSLEGKDHAVVFGVVVRLNPERARDCRDWWSVGTERIAPGPIDDHCPSRGRSGIAARGAIGADDDAIERRQPFSTAAALTSRMALVMLMPRGQASTQLKIVRQRHTPSLSARISRRSLAASSRESKMKRCALTIAAGPTYDFCAQNEGH